MGHKWIWRCCAGFARVPEGTRGPARERLTWRGGVFREKALRRQPASEPAGSGSFLSVS